jgi:NAD(P)-dependent dehydrogenase (short-subunit alcohol dehydrogenase family)
MQNSDGAQKKFFGEGRTSMTAEKTRDRFDLTGRVALVIGGSSGIGRAIAVGLAEAGADVVASSRRIREVAEVAKEIRARGRRSLEVTSDGLESEVIKRVEEDPAGYVARYAEQPENNKDGILTIATDAAKELFPEFRENAAGNDRDVAAAAKRIQKGVVATALARPVDRARPEVQIMTASPGSGKTTGNILGATSDPTGLKIEHITDDFDASRRLLQQVIDSGRRPVVRWVYVDDVGKTVDRMLRRAAGHDGKPGIGRTVQLNYMAQGLSPEALHLLSLAESEIERVSRIARQTLAFYRETTKPIRVDLRELLNISVDVHGMRKIGLRVHRRYRTSQAIPGYVAELQQLFHNLVANSVDAGATDLWLHLHQSNESGPSSRPGVRITIADNGCGIDPTVQSRLFNPFITTKGDKGIQSQRVAACVKHFAANNREWNRDSYSSNVSERTLEEIYSPTFREAVQDGSAWAVMTAANAVNHTLACQNHWLLTDTLKDEWEFPGLVLTDYDHARDTDKAALAGLDAGSGISG